MLFIGIIVGVIDVEFFVGNCEILFNEKFYSCGCF